MKWNVKRPLMWLQFNLRRTWMLLLLNECMQLQLKRYFTPLQLQISIYRRKSCITKVFKIHPLDTMNVCETFLGNLSNGCWAISVWSEVVAKYDSTLNFLVTKTPCCKIIQVFYTARQNKKTTKQLKYEWVHQKWILVYFCLKSCTNLNPNNTEEHPMPAN